MAPPGTAVNIRKSGAQAKSKPAPPAGRIGALSKAAQVSKFAQPAGKAGYLPKAAPSAPPNPAQPAGRVGALSKSAPSAPPKPAQPAGRVGALSKAATSAPLVHATIDRRPAQVTATCKKRAMVAPSPGIAKRPRVADEETKRLAQELRRRWGLEDDSAARYVMDVAEFSELEALQRANFCPNWKHKMSCPEQVNLALLKNKERDGCPGTALDTVSVFKHRWHLQLDDETMLRELCHKDLRHVICEYDGTRPLREVAEEASLIDSSWEEMRASSALPTDEGVFTLSRFNRLELIDPIADALVLGDANLSFSLILCHHRQALGQSGSVISTTFEDIEQLRERYAEIDETVSTIQEFGQVLHNVDCTRLAVDQRFLGMEEKFGAVYYNFPHAGVVQGFFDGHPFVRWRHENLMHLFFRALRAFVKPGGSVKVSSNAGATGVRYSDIITAAASNEFLHVETVPFLEWGLNNYLRSYGDRRDKNRRPDAGDIYANQRAQSDMVYCFCYSPSGEAVAKPRIRYPPSKSDLLNSKEGKLGQLTGAAKESKVEEVYDLFLSYVRGIHIG